MKANEFIKKFGWEKAKEKLEELKRQRVIGDFFNDLKQYVDAYELVQSYGGLKEAKEWMEKDLNDEYWDEDCERRKKAITLVEECQ